MRLRDFLFPRRKRSNSGSAAVEFALIAPVFLMLTFAIIETGMCFFANMVLEDGVENAARLIRTGQAQNAGTSQSAFRTDICNYISILLSCGANLQIDVESYSSFGSASFPSAQNADGSLNTSLSNYSTGAACSIVLVRAFYTWPLYTPLFAQYFANMPGNNRLLTSSMAFRNEPYGSTAC
jgi:Flp pilus assembly protein TadG